MVNKKVSKKADGKKAKAKNPTAKISVRKNLDRSSTVSSLRFLRSAHQAVRSHLRAASDLPTFLASAGSLSLSQRKLLVEQALILIKDNFVHLPLKESMHAVDPVQKLRLIQHRLDHSNSSTMGSEFQFHRDMIEVFTSVRDLHTNYLLPAPFSDKIAFLPFDIEEYSKGGNAHYIATHIMPGFSHAHFKEGVEITKLNAVPISRAIKISSMQHAGSNAAAQHARGVDGLTLRALRRSLPPNALWVIIGYTDLSGVEREMKQDWVISPSLPNLAGVDADSISIEAASLGIDIDADIRQRARMMLFAPNAITGSKKSGRISTKAAIAGQSVTSILPDVFQAKSVTTPSGEYAYIRIFTFNVNDPEVFVDEFVRLAELLPEQGLIIDVRGNGGGHIYASEGLLQTLTPRRITPEPTQFINTLLNGRICERHKSNPVGIDLGPWAESIRESVKTGAIFSRGYPITPQEFANSKGQKYHGPVVLITDARCYSATDIFAAGFKDHDVGHILGVDANTGAGGANVWTHDLLAKLLKLPSPTDPGSPYKALPGGAGMRVAIRRTMRVGDQAGTPVEDLGITPDSRHAMTREDLLNSNVDLINRAAGILKSMSVYRLAASTSQSGSTLTVQFVTAGYSRLDVYVDDRPVKSLDISDGANNFNISLPIDAISMRLEGFHNREKVAVRLLEL